MPRTADVAAETDAGRLQSQQGSVDRVSQRRPLSPLSARRCAKGKVRQDVACPAVSRGSYTRG